MKITKVVFLASLMAVPFVAAPAFGAVVLTTLNCATPVTANGQALVGTRYQVKIRSGFNTHGGGPGNFGLPIPVTFMLVRTAVVPGAVPVTEPLTLVSRGANFEYNLAGNGSQIVVNSQRTQAKVILQSENAVTSCR